MNTSDHSNNDLYKKFLDSWKEGVTGAVFSSPGIPPSRKWLYAVLVVYAFSTSGLAIFQAPWYAYAFLLTPFLLCIIPLIRTRFETKKRRGKNPPKPRSDATCERNDRGSPNSK